MLLKNKNRPTFTQQTDTNVADADVNGDILCIPSHISVQGFQQNMRRILNTEFQFHCLHPGFRLFSRCRTATIILPEFSLTAAQATLNI